MTTKANNSQQLHLFILAGEPSGDRIAADLIARLRQRTSVDVVGVGGDELTAHGLTPLFPMADLAVMGISDVVLNLPKLLWRLEQTTRFILERQPDIVVLVDAQDFSKLLARRLRRRGYKGKLVLYVTPSVWARNPERAARLKPLFDAILAVLPFEPKVMQDLNGPPTHYVGHPALVDALQPNQMPITGPLIFLPGSRAGELRRHMPLFKALAPRLASLPNVTEIVLPTLPSLRASLTDEVASWNTPVRIVADRSERRDIFEHAIGALCVSGTITLELALARVPMLVIYALDAHQAPIYSRMGRPAVSLPNIILGRRVVEEHVERTLTTEQVGAAAVALFTDEKARQRQSDAFGELEQIMLEGREDPAERILEIWLFQRDAIGW